MVSANRQGWLGAAMTIVLVACGGDEGTGSSRKDASGPPSDANGSTVDASNGTPDASTPMEDGPPTVDRAVGERGANDIA